MEIPTIGIHTKDIQSMYKLSKKYGVSNNDIVTRAIHLYGEEIIKRMTPKLKPCPQACKHLGKVSLLPK